MDPTYHLSGGFKPTLKRFADLEGPDFFPTPAWATHALIDNEGFKGDIWECACGDGVMSRVLELTGRQVASSDLYQRGYGEAGHDFLVTDRWVRQHRDQPALQQRRRLRPDRRAPSRAEVRAAAPRLLEGAGRAKTILLRMPPSRVWVFSERITFYPADAERKNSGTTAYAWFVWDRDAPSGTELKWFKPGYKARYASSSPSSSKS